jgi:hypothetical protein
MLKRWRRSGAWEREVSANFRSSTALKPRPLAIEGQGEDPHPTLRVGLSQRARRKQRVRRANKLDLKFIMIVTRREPGCGIAEHGAVIDAQGFDPALLSEGERDEKSELNQLGNREVLVQFFP